MKASVQITLLILVLAALSGCAHPRNHETLSFQCLEPVCLPAVPTAHPWPLSTRGHLARCSGMMCGSQRLHRHLNSGRSGRLPNPRKCGLHWLKNTVQRWATLEKAGFSICLPRGPIKPTCQSAVTVRSNAAATDPSCVRYWPSGALNSNESTRDPERKTRTSRFSGVRQETRPHLTAAALTGKRVRGPS